MRPALAAFVPGNRKNFFGDFLDVLNRHPYTPRLIAYGAVAADKKKPRGQGERRSGQVVRSWGENRIRVTAQGEKAGKHVACRR